MTTITRDDMRIIANNLRDFVVTVSESTPNWPDTQGLGQLLTETVEKAAKERQEEIAALLVARGWAARDKADPCSKSIRLRSIHQCDCRDPCHRGKGFLYLTEAGEILSGHTRREAVRVGPQTRRRMLGED